jgi:Spy/CpxP family protein refolding chaperone
MARNIRKTIAVAAGAALLAVGLGTAALAQGPENRRGGRGFGMGGRAGFPLGQLELTDAQRQQVRDVMQRHRDEIRAAADKLRDAQRAQRDAVSAMPVNEGLIRSTSQALADAQTELALTQARARSEVWTLLTPEQQAKAKELRTERENRMKERRDRMQQRRQPRNQPQG